MPPCTIVRIASGTNAFERYWTVRPEGALSLDSESQAQFFVCHSEVADRSCLIQHLQSGAFVEQGDDRKLRLTLSSASAAVFSKLRAYSQGILLFVVPKRLPLLLLGLGHSPAKAYSRAYATK